MDEETEAQRVFPSTLNLVVQETHKGGEWSYTILQETRK